MLTAEELIAFEEEISEIYCSGAVKAPVHLSRNNEAQLIEIFKNINRSDYVFSSWRSHYHALLHGVPRDVVKKKILEGDSITMCWKEYNFFSSAIVGATPSISMGVAWAFKNKGITDKKVYCFIGDMGSKGPDFRVCHEYAKNFDLPWIVIIENNFQSVGTPSSVVWGLEKEYKPCEPCMPFQIDEKTWEYRFNAGFPHVGAGKFITF